MAGQNRSAIRFKKSSNRSKKSGALVTVLVCILACVLVYFYDFDFSGGKQPGETVMPDGSAQVHYINVGQGDSELIISDDGSTMLIDAGEAEYGAAVVSYLESLGVTELDYIVATHPHSDHIGGLSGVLGSDIEVGVVITPEIPEEYTPTTKTYERFLDAVDEKGCTLTASSYASFEFGSGEITIIQPDYSGDNYNNYSTVVLFEFAGKGFLFTGDIEKSVEQDLIEAGYEMDADVLKVPHHGSSTSSCYDFLDAVSPEYCVIECGDSSYNHPNPDTVTRLRSYTDKIYRTDNDGSVVFTCSADGLSVSAEGQG